MRRGIERTGRLLLCAAVVACLVGAAPTLKSGRRVGQKIPSFYVRAVTGPLRNKSVCYVCRNGSRPCVMLLVRRLEPGLTGLLKRIEKVVDKNRAVGLKSFGVLIAEEPAKAVSQLQTLAFDEKIVGVPLAVATNAVSSASCQNIHPDATVTVVLYHRHRVVRTYAYRAGELKDKGTRAVLAGIRRMLDEP